jgi:hypothetical protein
MSQCGGADEIESFVHVTLETLCHTIRFRQVRSALVKEARHRY